MLTRSTSSLRLVSHRTLCSNASANLPKQADVVIIGGGSVGCSTFYHVTKMGVQNCVLLERHKLTAGTTWHTAGMLWHLRTSDLELELVKRTKLLISEILPEETGGDHAGWTGNGGLFTAATPERWEHWKYVHTCANSWGVESHLLTPKQTKELHPLLNVDDLYGSIYCPLDGTIDPAQWCAALTKVGKMNGGKVIENCAVDGFETDTNEFGQKRISAVLTAQGAIQTNRVVVCAGGWGPKLAAQLNLPAPTMAYHHGYAVSDTIEGVRGLPNVRDHEGALYLRPQGDAIQIGGYEQLCTICGDRGELEDDFVFGLYEVDYEKCFAPIVNAAVARMPALSTAGIKSDICGPMSESPDHQGLMGESPDVKGFIYGFGLDAGMLQGGGFGEQLANWAVNGGPSMHVHPFDHTRFVPGIARNMDWIEQRTHEAFVTIYDTFYPHYHTLAGRTIHKRSPFFEHLAEAGCFFGANTGWEVPDWFRSGAGRIAPVQYQWYGTRGKPNKSAYRTEALLDHTYAKPKHHDLLDAEAEAVTNRVAVFDNSAAGKLLLSGPDAHAAAQWLCTQNIHDNDKKVVYTYSLNEQGGFDADLNCCAIQDSDGNSCFYLVLPVHLQYTAIGKFIDKLYRRGLTDFKLENVTEQFGALSIHGPKSTRLFAELFPDLNFSSVDCLPMNSCVQHQDCILIRQSLVEGIDGYELHVPIDKCKQIWRRLHALSRKHKPTLIGARAMDSLAAEQGFHVWGRELRTTDLLSDMCGRENVAKYCKLDSGVQFCGAEELRNNADTNRRLVRVTLESRDLTLHGNETLYRNGEVVGFLRRGCYGYTIDKPLGFGYVTSKTSERLDQNWIQSGSFELECLAIKHPADVQLCG